MRKKVQKQMGFSLIEMAILLIVLGLIATPMIVSYNIFMVQLRINETRASFADITSAVNIFITTNGRYPIPASLNTREGDANFGVEGNPSPAPCPNPNWFTLDGSCETVGGAQVLIGAVPFDVLGLDPASGEDYWNQKILYAVTKSQTNSATFSQAANAGEITVRAYDSVKNVVTGIWTRLPPIDVSSDYDMVLVSPGATSIGGYSNQAALIQPCATPPSVTIESENCDFDSTFFLDRHPIPSREKTGAGTTAQTADFYDDLTDAQDTFPLTTWFENAIDPNYVMTLSDHIGIGETNPQIARIHINGNMQAGDAGNPMVIKTAGLCDGSSQCFEPDLIGGYRAEMDCEKNALPGSEPVIEIGSGQVYCGMPVNSVGTVIDTASGQTFNFTVFTGFNCGPGELMTGIDATGAVQCDTP